MQRPGIHWTEVSAIWSVRYKRFHYRRNIGAFECWEAATGSKVHMQRPSPIVWVYHSYDDRTTAGIQHRQPSWVGQ